MEPFFFFDDQLFETLILVEAVLESCKFPNCQERNQLIHDKGFGLLRPYGWGSACLVVNPALYENTIDTHVNISIDKLAMGSYILLFLSIIYTQNSSQDIDSLYISERARHDKNIRWAARV